jgi:hypothetical protein
VNNFDWDHHWWLIVILAIFAVPIIQAIFEPWRRYLRYRLDRAAIETLKTYAANGREPPPEVMDALVGRKRFRRAIRSAAESAADVAATWSNDDHWGGRSWDIRVRRDPFRRWNWPIFTGAVAAGFGVAWYYGHQTNETFLIVAIIAGILTVAGALSATIASLWRVD